MSYRSLLAHPRLTWLTAQLQIATMKDLEQYVSAQKTEHTMQRNEAMAEALEAQLSEHSKAVKSEDLVRVYNMLDQNTEDILSYYEDKESEGAKLIQAKGFVFRALRCCHIAGKFAAEARYAEAVALHDRANGLSRLAQAHLQQCEATEQTEKHTDQLQQLQLKIRGAKCAAQAAAFLEEHELSEAQQSADGEEQKLEEGLHLEDRLDTWRTIKAGEAARLVDFPPSVQPIPCKPVLYDLAFNYVKMPDFSHRVTKKPEGMLGKAKGILGRLWG